MTPPSPPSQASPPQPSKQPSSPWHSPCYQYLSHSYGTTLAPCLIKTTPRNWATTSPAFMLLQFLYAIQTVRAGLQTHDGNGTLSLVELLLQAAAFLWLAVAQTLRSWSKILWPDPGSCRSVGRFLEWFLAFYGTINTHVAYFVAGVGYLVLFCVDLLDSRDRIRL
ncbi:hypothetical protein N656DRAFT_513741 [Canariomyces notabilis]|uniref:Uncharacterized protein n=1 Tax=Canariomyces notabilis TaxID=2074819 RepID=A0AAN6QD19_9PEZI|nr:hypothetical protein N656DRAFT_513741 [Canariomyces arenarius]